MSGLDSALARSEALLGEAAMANLARARVLVVGLGGVGSWCAEALLRTGVGHLILVDDDVVSASNLNRQCPAIFRTLGLPKADALRAHLLDIFPGACVESHVLRYPAEDLRLDDIRPDAVVDAIDSVDCKARLIADATAGGIPVFSSMGAALRLDPGRVRASRFEKVSGDGLARALRQRFKREKRFPAARFECVWSDEPPRPLGDTRAARGSLMTVTATFGLRLAGLVLDRLAHGSVCGSPGDSAAV